MTDVLLDLYLLGGAAALAGVLALLGLGVNYLVKKIKWGKVRAVTEAAWGILDSVIREANTEMLLKLKEAQAEDSDGGKEVTKAEWDAAKSAAVAKFKKLWGLDKLALLAGALGISIDSLDDWLGASVASGLDPK